MTQQPSKIFGDGSNNPYIVDITDVPVDPGSEHYMNDIRSQLQATNGTVIMNASQYNASFVVADENTPRVNLEFDNCQNKPAVPAGLFDGPAHFTGVPVPPDALPAEGTDAALSIWSPSTDQLWEFWQMKQQGDGKWSACWGGRIDNVSASDGTFPYPYGTSASGMAMVGAMISVHEGAEADIEHAMRIGLLSIAETPIAFPANRTDGTSTSPSAPPMGARLRLDPDVDVESLDMTPLGKAVARAAQKYGFIVSETSHAVAIDTESGQHAEQQSGKNPWVAIFGNTPDYAQLKNFPWDKVEVIQLGYSPVGQPGGLVERGSESRRPSSSPSAD